MKKLTPILALALLASTLLTSCAGSSDDGASDTTAADVTSADVTTEAVEPDLTFDGEDFTIWYRNDNVWGLTDIYVEGENGDLLNDAVYARNMEAEDRFDISIKGVPSSTIVADGSDAKTMSSVILSGEDVYDVILPASLTAAPLITEKMLVDFNTLPNVDLDNPWWDQNIRQTMSINNKQYVMSSDLCIVNARASKAIYINRDIADSLGIDAMALFESASNGTWTFEQMMETGKPATTDLNGDGTMDDTDRYAFLHSINSAKNLPISANVMATGKNDDDTLNFVLDNEQSVTALTYLIEKVIHTDDTLRCESDSEKKQFIAGRGMFTFLNLIHLETMRAEEFNFSLLPMPKYNEQQESYRTHAPSFCTSFIAVPITAQKLDMIGYILEKMSEISSRTLIPAYYDVALTAKLTRDEESAAMLDIILANIVHEPADMFKFANIINELGNVLNNGTSVASFIESKKSAVVAAIDEYNQSMS